MTGFIACEFLSRNRVSLKEAFEGLELCEGKLSCTVLRGLDGSNPVRLLDNTPSELQMTEGDHTVTVKKTGFKEWERRLSGSAGSSVHLNAELERAAGQ